MIAPERGFSLVEVMATLAVMSLAIGMVASSVNASLTAANRLSDDPGKALRRVISILGAAAAAPAPAGGLARIAPVFGDERRVHFITADENDGGFMANRFTASRDGLRWDRTPVRHEREVATAVFSDIEAISVPHLPDMRFAYRAKGQAGWRSDWAAGPAAPDLVRVQVRGRGGRILTGVAALRTGQ